MLYRISVAERGLTGIANIFRSRLSRLDDLLRAGTVPLTMNLAVRMIKASRLCAADGTSATNKALNVSRKRVKTVRSIIKKEENVWGTRPHRKKR